VFYFVFYCELYAIFFHFASIANCDGEWGFAVVSDFGEEVDVASASAGGVSHPGDVF
jgi:hypothetical protein